eukprot:3224643-Rhodomonas_salina.2
MVYCSRVQPIRLHTAVDSDKAEFTAARAREWMALVDAEIKTVLLPCLSAIAEQVRAWPRR